VAMKHVNEKMPDVQRKRPEVSSALAAVVERATQKKVDKRYPDMSAMLADLEAALEVEVARAGGSHGEATTVLESVPGPRRRIFSTRNLSVIGILLVLAGVAAALIIAANNGSDKAKGGGNGDSGTPAGTEVALTGAKDFDPDGDGSEHPEVVKNAIDGSPTSTWMTETYTAGPVLADSANKPGVGLIVSTDQSVDGTSLTVSTTDGGWDADVYAANTGPPVTLQGWGQPVGSISNASPDQQIDLTLPQPARFYLIWFTKLSDESDGGRVEVRETKLTANG